MSSMHINGTVCEQQQSAELKNTTPPPPPVTKRQRATEKEETDDEEEVATTNTGSNSGKGNDENSNKRKKPKKKKKARKGVPDWLRQSDKPLQQQGEDGDDGGAMYSPCRPPKNLEVTVKNGVRYLQPYWGILCGYAKRRWVGRTVNEVFAAEFSNLLNPLYAKAACRKGRIFVNKHPIMSAEHRIRHNDFFVHINHRHETEIPDLPIQVLADNDDVLVLNKPAGLPVHPCGNYCVHTMLGLLRREYGREQDKLACLYRLDRTTTGVLMFAKTAQFDSHFKTLIRERKLVKEYVCKVEGKFPEGETVCDAPLGILCHSLGLRCVRPDGQETLSSFSLLRYLPAENASLVSCTILTGRTHQIRIHLQFLGHPIIGDWLYNDDIWGPNKGKAANYGERTFEQLSADISKRHTKTRWILEQDHGYEQRLQQIGDDEFCEVEEFDLKNLEAELHKMPAWDPLCWGCAVLKKRQMQESDWLMALHCRRYSADGWSYEAPLPNWALGGHNNNDDDGKMVIEQLQPDVDDSVGNTTIMNCHHTMDDEIGAIK